MARTRTENTEWLTADEQRAWRSLVKMMAELQAELETALVDAHNLTEGEYGVLVHLSESPDHRLRMCDLASVLQLSPSGLTSGSTVWPGRVWSPESHRRAIGGQCSRC